MLTSVTLVEGEFLPAWRGREVSTGYVRARLWGSLLTGQSVGYQCMDWYIGISYMLPWFWIYMLTSNLMVKNNSWIIAAVVSLWYDNDACKIGI